MGKTIGILTFNRASNYGAVLQAYALKAVCEELGYEVHIINYIKGIEDDSPRPIKKFLSSENKKSALITLCRNLLGFYWDKKRWKEFVLFREKYLNESEICLSKDSILKLNYDYYIVGSDQIWNYNITGKQFDPVYFGDFSDKDNCILYAASAHDTPFPLDKEIEFKKLLEHTTAKIGIREQKLADYVEKLTGIEYPVVLDPTLLAGRKIMERIVDSKINECPYILLYQIDTNPVSDISVKNLEKSFDCKVYSMTVPRIGDVKKRKGEVGPEKFLGLIKNAKFIVTNSFHGIALSLIFEKLFFVYENNGVMERIDNLLKEVGLSDRKVKMTEDIDCNKMVNYNLVNSKLDTLRNKSMQYLKDALDGKSVKTVRNKPEQFTVLPMNERKKEDCSGCSACLTVCPVDAISMEYDEEGFLYPKINLSLCIHCGKCDKICSFVHQKTKTDLPKAFGVKHKDENTRLTSRSGAAFIAISDNILQKKGIIYGAAINSAHFVRHIRATTENDRDCMKGAKYVQSDIRGIYEQVKKDLQDDRYVLFSGTPCQVSGLYTFLRVNKLNINKLYTCDLVCHGVPSPLIWKNYVKHIENKYKGKVLESNFRDKMFGWDSHCETFLLDNGKRIVSRDYTDLFYDHIMMRPSCHKCYFANVNRIADITLADFWGIEKNNPEFNDNKGVSLVLVNSKKGMELFDHASKDLEWFECDIKKCMQPTLIKPTSCSLRREMFWQDYQNMEFESLLRKYTTPLSFLAKCKRNLKQILFKIGLRKHP